MTTALSRLTSLENPKLETSSPGPGASESSGGQTGGEAKASEVVCA